MAEELAMMPRWKRRAQRAGYLIFSYARYRRALSVAAGDRVFQEIPNLQVDAPSGNVSRTLRALLPGFELFRARLWLDSSDVSKLTVKAPWLQAKVFGERIQRGTISVAEEI